MPQLRIDRHTGQKSYRYRSREMSGPLPAVLYKYLPLEYAHAMIDRGELMFSTLTWFQNVEDAERGDTFEGTHKYFPVRGLEVTRVARGGRSHEPVTTTLPTDSLQSRARASDRIFIYSTSLQGGLAAFDKPDQPPNACVEIHDPVKFLVRLRGVVRLLAQAKAGTLIHDTIQYYSFADPPGNVHALPDRLTMTKHDRFKSQREYRFAFGTKRDVFDFENVEYVVVREGFTRPRQILRDGDHRMKVRLGSLPDCCRLI